MNCSTTAAEEVGSDLVPCALRMVCKKQDLTLRASKGILSKGL
jgi:hypothetical protein